MDKVNQLPFDVTVGRRQALRDPSALVSIYPLLGALERWIVQEFTVSGAVPATIFSYTAKSDVFFYGLKVSMTAFEYQMIGGLQFYVNDNLLSEPTSADNSFPVGNGIENLFPFHLHLKPTQTFRIKLSQGPSFFGKTTISGIVHVRGAIV